MASTPVTMVSGKPAWPSSGYAWFVTVIMTLAFTLAYIDRNVMSMLAVAIKRDLGLSDSQVGLIIGLAFSCSYALAAIPVGRIVDASGRRRLIVVIGVLTWSCLTALSGTASAFWSLFLARALVGVGEATIFPASSSLIGDYFPPQRRMRAASVLLFGGTLGGALAFLLGGILLKAYEPLAGQSLPVVGVVQPWQMVFYTLGAVGILFAPLALLIKEPIRRDVQPARVAEQADLRQVCGYLLGEGRGLLALLVSVSLMLLLVLGLLAWLPAVFARRFDWVNEKTGAMVGGIGLFAGIVGTILANLLVERFTKAGKADALPRAALWFCALGAAPLIGSVLLPSGEMVALALVPALTLAVGFAPFGQGAIQLVAPNRMRGQVVAVYMIMTTLVSAALGPLLVAFFTDYVFKNEMKLHYSMAMTGALIVPSAGLLLWYSRKRFAAMATETRLDPYE